MDSANINMNCRKTIYLKYIIGKMSCNKEIVGDMRNL